MFCAKKNLSNVVSVLAFCPLDNTFLLLLDEERKDYWIPSMKMLEKHSWRENLQIFKKKLFDCEVVSEKLLKIYKIWTLEKEYFHLIFQVDLPKEIKTNCKTQTSLGRVYWYSCGQLPKLKSFLRSLEILEVTHHYTPRVNRHAEKSTGETIPMGSLTEVHEADILVTPEGFDNQVYINLLESSAIPIEEQYKLYEDFFMHTYPCIYMNLVTFKRAIGRFTFNGDLKSLFKAADVWKREFLTFQDYLFLLAVMDPQTGHYGTLAEIRCQYIFRYYNENEDGKMTLNEFKNMNFDIQLEKMQNPKKTEIDNYIDSVVKTVNFKSNSVLTFDQFFTLVLQAKIRGTSHLLRFKENYESAVNAYGKDLYGQLQTPSKILIPSMISDSNDPKGNLDYKIVLKPTLLKPGNSPVQLPSANFFEDAVTRSVYEELKILPAVKANVLDTSDLDLKINELLLAVRYFCTEIYQGPICCSDFEYEVKNSYSWGSAYLSKLGIIVIMMCEVLKDILSKEPRLLKIDPPVFIMGDLHGNLHDLICFEKILWPNGISLAPAKFLFLGDYVDRGLNSLEVIMYLFANKIQNPEKLFLVRGNHEIRDIQKLFTFQKECISKLGVTLGTSVWKAINDAFDVMPLAAVVDHKVFCCHGGIPPPWLCPTISVIDTIPCPLTNCEKQSPLAWNLMWNDPLKNAFSNRFQEIELLTNDGFAPNLLRGTGFLFNCDALERFLLTNKLSHVVRAHEVVKTGFQVHQRGKLLTVFSSSAYCGGKNYAGGILVADNFLRVFVVDTEVN